MKLNWQVCSFEQAKELHSLGIKNPSDLFIWFVALETVGKPKAFLGVKSSPENGMWITEPGSEGILSLEFYHAFTLSEIAVMLEYSFVSPNVREAAERLIVEIKNGSQSVTDSNARLIEAHNQ